MHAAAARPDLDAERQPETQLFQKIDGAVTGESGAEGQDNDVHAVARRRLHDVAHRHLRAKGHDIHLVDPQQRDVKEDKCGLLFLERIIRKHNINDCGIIKFTSEDCVRSGICKAFVQAFDKERTGEW